MTGTEISTVHDVAGAAPEAFLRASYLAQYREPTRAGYALIVEHWYAWCHRQGLRPLDVKRAHIEVWMRWLEEDQGLMASTIAGKLGVVRGLYKTAVMDEMLPGNPAQWVKAPKVPQESTTLGLNRSELLQLLDLAQASSPQDHAILCVLGLNGLRVGELCSLTIKSVTRQGGYIVLTFYREKNVKLAQVPLLPRTSHAVEQAMYGRSSGPLFLLRNEAPMDRRGVDRIIKKLCKRAGITKRITPHSFRHSFITLSLNAGVPLRDVSNSVGHSDSRATARYDRGKDSLARNAANWIAPYVEGSV